MPRRKISQNSEEDRAFAQEDIPTQATANKIFRDERAKRAAEKLEYVPLVEPKHTVEVLANPKPTREEIEHIETEKIPEPKPEIQENKKIKAPKKKNKSAKKAAAKDKRFEPPEKSVLSGDSILVITEKPQAAEKIAAALSEGRARRYSEAGVPFYEFQKNGSAIIVSCAVGHLFSLSQDAKGSNYPVFEISWKPNFQVRKKDFTRKYYTNLMKLAKRAREIIVATDYDIEGELIGYNIIRFIAGQRDAKRMKFSSLTKNELEEAFQKASPTINWGQAIAGETRHFIDWYYGINLSRALMNSIKSAGRFRIMSIGRVQGPALKMIVDKEREIQAFKPATYWKIFIEVRDKKDKTNKIRLRHNRDIFKEKELEKFRRSKGKEADVKTEKTMQTIQPPHPFDLTTLQIEAYKFFFIAPAKTLQIAQQLYLAGLISYPRTSSQKIPEAINPKRILSRLSEKFSQVKLAIRTMPVEGKKSDPAHPSIYPTGEFQELGGDEKKIYELIARRFISCFCADAKVENKKITAVADSLIFNERGLEIKEKGWMEVYQAVMQEKEIRDMNGKADIMKVDIEKDETKPPRRYSPASIISELEKHGLGTKATRANIIETLYERNYITDNKSVKATLLGMKLINALEKYSPIIIDEKLTRNMEKDMEILQVSKKDLDRKESGILGRAKESLVKISEDFKKKESEIGKELAEATEEIWKQQKEENEISVCQNCKKGKLTIKYSPKNRKSFVACDAYPDCKTTFSLPPYGFIKKADDNKLCDKCGFPLLMSIRKARRPWVFCFNPNCESRKEGVYAAAKKDESSEEKEVKESEETEDH